ncbi:hypothetical protein SDRG_10145 [Saprolegnia diclina VS20]|uniref:HORMA domain-containing protein n=1 Tax=Saprolegnia diclina (strain VS20) TaxID=1156394 RepID=T0RQN0_SAPDV|nr:hypothetical protein SDRG_10145 [Saprolegnia diclina VS20]EQC32402.1 hypothetical protein SDRG_10145 [Saprolegnia diclina VS20]|eukprot:XP_008614343.1 hypothetical protein SDRG_10145 [Saprolegnia diclina VS20]
MTTVLADLVVEFLEVGVHEFIYGWQVYPPELFERCQKYSVPVHVCRHPALGEYIHTMLESCRAWIVDGRLDKLHVAILAASGEVLDTCVFEVGVHASAKGEMPLVAIEEAFRKALVHIASAPAVAVAPAGTPFTKSFRLYVDTYEESAAPETRVQEELQNSWVLTPDEPYVPGRALYPIASTASALPLRLNVYVVREPPLTGEPSMATTP